MSNHNNRSTLHDALNEILNTHAYKRVNGRPASQRTVTAYTDVLSMCFGILHKLGYKIQNPRNIKEEHVKVLCQHWHSEGLAVSTMQEYLSKLRVFGKWINKPGMVKSLATYLPDVDKKLLVVRKTAIKSKSWSEHGIDIAQKTQEADAQDLRFGLMIRMMLAFGLRRKEVVHCRPHVADRGDKLVVFPGETKGTRPRDIFIDTIEQRQILDLVKGQVKKGAYLGWYETARGKSADLKYSLERYKKLMARIGITKYEKDVTGHGLRAQFAENAALIAGLVPPTLGGAANQKAKGDILITRMQVSQLLGHARPSITNSYYGSFNQRTDTDVHERCKSNFDLAIKTMRDLLPVPKEKMVDCLQLVCELSELNVDATPQQVYLLWSTHSRRFGVEWVTIRARNLEALEAAAIHLVKNMNGQTDSFSSQEEAD